MKKGIIVKFSFLLLTILNSCYDPCSGVGCLNGGVCNQGDCLCPEGFIGENCETADPAFNIPFIECGDNWTSECLDAKWDIFLPTNSTIQTLTECREGENCLLLVNPHNPLERNPDFIILKTILKNIEVGSAYRVSCTTKIKGYPDYLNNPGLAFYAFSNNNWYGEYYLFSTGGIYYEKDWTNVSYSFVGGPERTLEFELSSTYDSVWISNLRIKKL